jgi:mannose-6-phosphate isomerase-like protein (cupin superfamily)
MMRRLAIGVVCVTALLGMIKVTAHGQAAAPAAQAAPAAPKDKAAYWPNTELQTVWKNLEAKQVINQRVADGGSFSINIRIVKENDAPLVHATSADVWVVQAGTATAITDGKMVDPQKRPNADDIAGKSITGGTERPLKAGDILFVPPGVPHGFKDVKGFRAFLIRFDTK